MLLPRQWIYCTHTSYSKPLQWVLSWYTFVPFPLTSQSNTHKVVSSHWSYIDNIGKMSSVLYILSYLNKRGAIALNTFCLSHWTYSKRILWLTQFYCMSFSIRFARDFATGNADPIELHQTITINESKSVCIEPPAQNHCSAIKIIIHSNNGVENADKKYWKVRQQAIEESTRSFTTLDRFFSIDCHWSSRIILICILSISERSRIYGCSNRQRKPINTCNLGGNERIDFLVVLELMHSMCKGNRRNFEVCRTELEDVDVLDLGFVNTSERQSFCGGTVYPLYFTRLFNHTSTLEYCIIQCCSWFTAHSKATRETPVHRTQTIHLVYKPQTNVSVNSLRFISGGHKHLQKDVYQVHNITHSGHRENLQTLHWSTNSINNVNSTASVTLEWNICRGQRVAVCQRR